MTPQEHPPEALATKVTQVLPRPDGSEAKIVAETMYGAGLHPSVDVTVFERASPAHDWQLCSNRPAENWRQMPLDEYLRTGRSKALRTVKVGEILKVTSMLGKPLSSFASTASA